MDLSVIGAVALLIVWAYLAFTTAAPGYVHLLLTLGVFLLIWRITVIGSRNSKPPAAK